MTQDIIDALRKVAANFEDKLGDANLLAVAADEIESLRRERDEARRELCEFAVGWQRAGMRVQHPQQYAQERGWDCFGEETDDGA